MLGATVSLAAGWVDYLRVLSAGLGGSLVRVVLVHQVLAYATTVVYLASFILRRRFPAFSRQGRLTIGLVGIVPIAATTWYGHTVRNLM